MIQIDGLKFSYKGRPVYDGLNLELKDGAVYGLLGRNGAGKTTLMRLIAGLLKCKKGRITVDGSTPFERKPEFLNSVCFVPESFNAPDMPVIDYAGNYGMFYTNYDGDAMMDYLKAFDVEPNAIFRRLSAGQKKKALISFALALNTRLLLLDEPGNGLDIPSKLCLRRLISEHLRPDRTVLLSTHQVRDIQDIVDHVTVIDSGRLLLNSSLEDIAGKLCFIRTDKVVQDALYSERTSAGYINILPRLMISGSSACGSVHGNNTISDTEKDSVDIEVLFNACISSDGYFAEYLQKYEDINLHNEGTK